MSIYVVFFGGFHSSQRDMAAWKSSAEKQRKDVTFDAFPYPSSAGSKAEAAVKGFESQFDVVLKKIAALDERTTVFVVGHSSGCAIANELNSRLPGDHKNVTVVDLDGFRVLSDQKKNSTVQLWCAEGRHPKNEAWDWNTIKKRLPANWESEQCKGTDWEKSRSVNWACDKQKYQASWATNPWSLHFSMVNTAATDAITFDTYAIKGYADCRANLCFLS
jgi:hypothetical protein